MDRIGKNCIELIAQNLTFNEIATFKTCKLINSIDFYKNIKQTSLITNAKEKIAHCKNLTYVEVFEEISLKDLPHLEEVKFSGPIFMIDNIKRIHVICMRYEDIDKLCEYLHRKVQAVSLRFTTEFIGYNLIKMIKDANPKNLGVAGTLNKFMPVFDMDLEKFDINGLTAELGTTDNPPIKNSSIKELSFSFMNVTNQINMPNLKRLALYCCSIELSRLTCKTIEELELFECKTDKNRLAEFPLRKLIINNCESMLTGPAVELKSLVELEIMNCKDDTIRLIDSAFKMPALRVLAFKNEFVTRKKLECATWPIKTINVVKSSISPLDKAYFESKGISVQVYNGSTQEQMPS